MIPTSKLLILVSVTNYINPLVPCSFVQRTFQRSLRYARPDLILFLGDIFDEGSIASEQEYEQYVKRFNRIFRHNPKIPVSTSLAVK